MRMEENRGEEKEKENMWTKKEISMKEKGIIDYGRGRREH
jgi:hypothetical protein